MGGGQYFNGTDDACFLFYLVLSRLVGVFLGCPPPSISLSRSGDVAMIRTPVKGIDSSSSATQFR